METVKQLREKHKLLQKDMADLLGLSITGYSSKENNFRKFKTHEAIKISNFFNVPMDEIENFLDSTTHKAYKGNKQTA